MTRLKLVERSLTQWFMAFSRENDVSLSQSFNAYLKGMPERLKFNVERADQAIQLVPCSDKEAALLLVVGLRLANPSKPHPNLQSIRAVFENSYETFLTFEDAEINGKLELGILRNAFGDFTAQRLRLEREMF